MSKFGVVVALLCLATAGCGDGATVGVAEEQAAAAEAALASEDFVASECPVERNSSNAIQGPRTSPKVRSDSVAAFENAGPPQKKRNAKSELWGTKYPLNVAVDRGPVEIAIVDEPGANVRMTYVKWVDAQSLADGFQKVQFNPCEEDASKAYRFWPGGFLADRRDVCVKVAVRDGSGDVTTQRVELGAGCPAETD